MANAVYALPAGVPGRAVGFGLGVVLGRGAAVYGGGAQNEK